MEIRALVSVTIFSSIRSASSPVNETRAVESPRLRYVRTIITGQSVGGNVQDPTAMRDPVSGLYHIFALWGKDGSCGWAGNIRHFYSSTSNLSTARWIDGGLTMNLTSDPWAPDSNGQFMPGIMRDPADGKWFLFYSALGKGGDPMKHCVTEPFDFQRGDCLSSQLVASADSPHGPWTKLGMVSNATHDGVSWNERLVDGGRPLIIAGRAYWALGHHHRPLGACCIPVPQY